MDEAELSVMIEELCYSKAEEFMTMGYENVTGQDIWLCVSSTYKGDLPALHQIVNDILGLKINKYMNWLLIKTYKTL